MRPSERAARRRPHHRRLRRPARGTATSTGSRTAARRRRSPRSLRPIACGCKNGIIEVDPHAAAAGHAGGDHGAGCKRGRRVTMADNEQLDRCRQRSTISPAAAAPHHGAEPAIALSFADGTVRRRVQHLQSCRRAARRRRARRRLHRLPVAPVEIPPRAPAWASPASRRTRCRPIRSRSRTAACSSTSRTDAAKRAPHAPHPLARQIERAPGPFAARRHLDDGDGRSESALLGLRPSARPRAEGGGRRRAPRPQLIRSTS